MFPDRFCVIVSPIFVSFCFRLAVVAVVVVLVVVMSPELFFLIIFVFV